jgi:hypothetical protein
MKGNHWYLVSSHGAVLFYIIIYPDCTIADICDRMALSRRTVWGIVGDLKRAGMLQVRKAGRRHHYTANMDAPFRHPTLDGIRLADVFSRVKAGAPEQGVPPVGRQAYATSVP